ncbi:hypothetical protein ES708_27289 [subsurface metagenome]
MDLNHWIRLSRIHIKGKGDNSEWNLYNLLLNSTNSEEVIFPLSIVHMQEIGGSRYSENARKNLAKTIIDFTKENCIQPLFATVRLEANFAVIKTLTEKLQGDKQKFARELLEEVIDAKEHYPYFPIGKGFPALLGAEPQLIDSYTGEEITDGIVYEKTQEYLTDPDKLIELASSESMRLEYNKILNDFQSIIQNEKRLTNIRKTLHKTRKEDVKFAQFFYWSGIREILVTEIQKWSKLLFIDLKEAIITVLRNEKGAPDKNSIFSFHKLMPSVWCWFKLEQFRDRHYSREITPNDIFDINALANALPYCDIVVCDKFYATATRETKLDKFGNKIVTHKMDDLIDLL